MFTWRVRVSPSMVVAVVALVVALGGTSYAVVRLPARSVGARELKRQAVAKTNIKVNAIDGSKVANDSLTGADIKEDSLAKVPAATSADRAGSGGALDIVFYKSATQTVPAAPPEPGDPAVAQTTFATQLASCDRGQQVLGGGVKLDDPENTAVVDSYPTGGVGWTAHVSNDHVNTPHAFTVYAICVPAGAAG